MAIWDKKPEGDDFLAPRPQADAPVAERTHSLAEIAVDAGLVDVTPSTSSIEIVTE